MVSNKISTSIFFCILALFAYSLHLYSSLLKQFLYEALIVEQWYKP
jgi:hypothetical protein